MALILCKEPGRLILFRTAKGSADLPARHVPFSKACANLAATKVAHALMVDVRRPHVLPHMHANFLHEYMQKITDWHQLEQGCGLQTVQALYRIATTVNMAGWHNTSPFCIACTESKQQRMPAAEWLCLPGTHSKHCAASYTFTVVTYTDLVVHYIYICINTDN